MRKHKKSRVSVVELGSLKGTKDNFYITIPYDKKYRVIPSSVDCVYNSDYFGHQETVNMLRAL